MIAEKKVNNFFGSRFLSTSFILGGISLFGFLRRKNPPPLHTAGQTSETIAFTRKLVEEGKISPDEKLRLDNMAIRENSLANLNGFKTYAEEKPDEWENFLTTLNRK